MKYLVLIILSLAKLSTTFAQNGKLNLISSKWTDIIDQNKFKSIVPVYEHNGNTLSADSGIFYKNDIGQEFFEAFGNVVITQPSGTVIYSDRLHYDAALQHARLTGNVKMVDAASVLTTNYLTYNMRSKTGTYRNGGRIVSRGDTITSRNAYYFENTSDAYFRHKVVVRTPNVKVYTDSMRYNSLTKETYFFGPTNIKGNKDENLYTERGTYNTGTGIAKFSKNNLYTEGTKFLKGDSLYYSRDQGVGKAFRNVVFVDTLDKFYAYGGKGTYRQDDESILMTDKPLIITVVKNDSTSQEAKADSVQIDAGAKRTKKELKQVQKEVTVKDNSNAAENLDEAPQIVDSPRPPAAKVDSVYLTADTLFSKVILVKDYQPLQLNLDRSGGQLMAEEEPDYGDDDENDEQDSTSVGNAGIQVDATIQRDSSTTVDATAIETSISPPKPKAKPVATSPKRDISEESIGTTLKADSTLRQKAVIPRANEADNLINEALKVAQTPDTLDRREPLATTLDSAKSMADTAKTRVVRAYYNVRLYKSDLQAVADSAYYGMVDSMFRFMGRPMIWAQGSQISADTIYMQLVNQQLDNALLKNNAFMVNAVLDTVKFNQLKGRKITAFFTNNSIDRLFVDGNAENISFAADEKTKVITEMFHDRGARIKVKMENKEIIDYTTVRKVDQKVYPFKMVTQENEILQGFIWRPQDRPTSKEDLLNRKRELEKPVIPADTAQQKQDGPTTADNTPAPLNKASEIKENIEKQSSGTEISKHRGRSIEKSASSVATKEEEDELSQENSHESETNRQKR